MSVELGARDGATDDEVAGLAGHRDCGAMRAPGLGFSHHGELARHNRCDDHGGGDPF